MKYIHIIFFAFFISISCSSKTLSKPLRRNISEKKMYAIIEKHLKSLKKVTLYEEVKVPVPIKDYVFVSSMICLTKEAINIERHSYSSFPIMTKNDLNILEEWYKQYKDQIPRDCFVKWWNYHANQESTWEDLQQAKDCVMK